MTYTQVSHDKFFERINSQKLDVQPRIVNDRYPYTASWDFHRLPGRPVYGKTVDRVEGGRTVTDYFLNAGA